MHVGSTCGALMNTTMPVDPTLYVYDQEHCVKADIANAMSRDIIG
jgi:hypothetical protein